MDTLGRTATAPIRRRIRPNPIHVVLAPGSNCNRRGLRIGHDHAGAIHSHLHRMFMVGCMLLGACSRTTDRRQAMVIDAAGGELPPNQHSLQTRMNRALSRTAGVQRGTAGGTP
jgi:hypothetical protein